MRIDSGAWFPIPGFPGYEICADAKIRKQTAKGYKMMSVRVFRGHNIVSLSRGGRQRTFRLRSLVGRTFLRPLRKGEVYTHKNGDTLDDVATNICIMNQSELSRRVGKRGTRRRAVEKVDEQGEVLDAYRSARQAADKNYISLMCVTNRCNGKMKTKVPPFFRWAK